MLSARCPCYCAGIDAAACAPALEGRARSASTREAPDPIRIHGDIVAALAVRRCCRWRHRCRVLVPRPSPIWSPCFEKAPPELWISGGSSIMGHAAARRSAMAKFPRSSDLARRARDGGSRLELVQVLEVARRHVLPGRVPQVVLRLPDVAELVGEQVVDTSARRSRIVRQSAKPVKRRKPGMRKNHGVTRMRTRERSTGSGVGRAGRGALSRARDAQLGDNWFGIGVRLSSARRRSAARAGCTV